MYEFETLINIFLIPLEQIFTFQSRFFKAPSKRVFHVYVEGSLIASNFDIYQQAGRHDTATVIQKLINVTDSNGLSLELVKVKENPSISGIEIIPYFGPVPTRAPSKAPTRAPVADVEPGQALVRINAGGADYLDSNGKFWSADKFVVGNGGQAYIECPLDIANTTDDILYCSNRWFSIWTGSSFIYSIPVASAGVYEVHLHFAEIVRFVSVYSCFIFSLLIYHFKNSVKFNCMV
jgi:Malectin domain